MPTDKMATTIPLRFTAKKGKQDPEGFEGAPKDVLETSIAGEPPQQSGLTVKQSTQTSEGPIEVNAVL
jgi:hypothetical protein